MDKAHTDFSQSDNKANFLEKTILNKSNTGKYRK